MSEVTLPTIARKLYLATVTAFAVDSPVFSHRLKVHPTLALPLLSTLLGPPYVR